LEKSGCRSLDVLGLSQYQLHMKYPAETSDAMAGTLSSLAAVKFYVVKGHP